MFLKSVVKFLVHLGQVHSPLETYTIILHSDCVCVGLTHDGGGCTYTGCVDEPEPSVFVTVDWWCARWEEG